MTLDLNGIRAKLEQERERLNGELDHLRADTQSTEDKSGGWFGRRDEQANEAAEMRKLMSSEGHLKDLLAQVEYALSKLDDGTYGRCDSCGQPIAPARLEALPYANLCVNCKALRKG